MTAPGILRSGHILAVSVILVCSAMPLTADPHPASGVAVEGGRGLMYMQTARTAGRGQLTIALYSMIMEKESRVYNGNTGSFSLRTDKPAVLAVPIIFGLTDEIDINAASYLIHDTRTLYDKTDVNAGFGDTGGGMGSTKLGMKVRLPFSHESRLQIAGSFNAVFDTSDKQAYDMNYRWTRTGTDIETSFHESLTLTSAITLHLSQGYVFSGSEIFDDQVVGGAGISITGNSRVSASLELNNRTFLGIGPQSLLKAADNPDSYLESTTDSDIGNPRQLNDDSADFMDDFLILTPSVKVQLTPDIALHAGVHHNIADQTDPHESWQFIGGITFRRAFPRLMDTDRDGVHDGRDREPETPPGYPVDSDGISLDTDGDGVPDPLDRETATPAGAITDQYGIGLDSDQDGVFDGLDSEPETPAGAEVDIHGVALDTDGDGVPDIFDEQPDTPRGAEVDSKGRYRDSDGDGVPNGLDKEPGTPHGAMVDSDGIGIDSDGDGVPDGLDREPATPAGILVDKSGRALLTHEARLIKEGLIRSDTISFDAFSATLTPESYAALDEIGTLLAKYPEIKMQIEGHSDSSGSSSENLRLSRERALAVRTYLLMHFPEIERTRLRAVGFGDKRPIASNDTAQGRRINRRVEFVIINKDDILRGR